ncbi:transposase [Oceanirhabdus seepicola]|uniref:Transposase n=1 Tax=Oceanirhabdus seepicola TaxID=2828781 RepID=A0A9J6P9J3_9CLOT|nr:transposase [Oceanirhabdus seepicola]MCM1992590.1 transposase [Oceanirhabdus seepicola]
MGKKSTTSSYVLTLELKTEIWQEDELNKRFEIGRKMFNGVLSEALKRYNVMIERKDYKQVRKQIKEINKKHFNCKNEDNLKKLEKQRKYLYKQLNELYKKYSLTEYSLINYIQPMYSHFKSIDSKVAQAIASRAWTSINKLLKGEANCVHFKKYGSLNTLENKWNKSGLKYKDDLIQWNGLKLPVIIKSCDKYAQIAIQDRVKYCRIKRKLIRGKYKYYVQLILEGVPPVKENKEIGEGNVGLDIGTQSIAISAKYDVKLLELAPEVNNIEKEKRRLLRKLDRQRRANNPNNFKEDGTVKKGIIIDGKRQKLKWIKSNRYMKILYELKDIQRKQTDIRKQSHEKLSNYIISLGDRILVETMNYKGLQARAKNTTVNEKTGKFNKKKRFGKSLANKAPSMLLDIINRKLQYEKLKLLKISTKKVKASQFNHIEDRYIKKQLNERWNNFGDFKIQRDLYSSFIIQNVIGKKLDKIDRENMINDFENFREMHNREIERLKNMKKDNYKLISSFGI